MAFSKMWSPPASSPSFFAEVSSSFSSLSKTLSNVNKVSQTIVDHIEDVKPPVMTAATSFASTCNAVERVLDKIAKIMEPFIKGYDFVKTMYKTIVDLVLKMVLSVKDKFILGYEWLLEKVESLDIVFIAFLVFALAILLLLYVCPVDIVTPFNNVVVTLFSVVGNFFSSLYNLDWFPTWSGKFSQLAQAAVLPGESLTHTPTSQLLSSLLAFGISTLVFVAVPGRPNGLSNPLSKILYSAGSGAQQCNQLFQLYRNMKDCTSQAFSWVLEIVVSIFGFKNPVLSAINATLSTDLFQWMTEVSEVAEPSMRLENFANPAFPIKLQHLKEQAVKISAYIATHPVAAFLSHRVSAAITQLDKLVAEASQHSGVGQYRIEPFMVQWFGASGCGKSTCMRLFINDVLDAMGEPKLNRLYAVSKRDAYWSNYAHQTAVLMDDMGALRDGAGQCQDIKDLIDIKSTQPAPLPMAAVEDKGRHFTSKYIFATSNLISAPAQCGLTYPDAFERRRDILVECRKVGDFDPNAPTAHLVFDVVESRRPHAITHRALSYDDLLQYVVAKCRVHYEVSSQLYNTTSGLADKVAQVNVAVDEVLDSFQDALQVLPPEPATYEQTITEAEKIVYSQELTVEALKYAYQGSMNKFEFFPHDLSKQAIYDVLSSDAKQNFEMWVNDLLVKGASPQQYAWLVQNIPDDYVMHFKSFIYSTTISEELLDVQRNLEQGKAYKALQADADTLTCIEQMPPRVQFLYTAFVRYWCRKVAGTDKKRNWIIECMIGIKDKMIQMWNDLPFILKLLIKAGLILIALNGTMNAVTAFITCLKAATSPLADGRGGVTNESNSISSKKNKGKTHFAKSLLGQAADNNHVDRWAEQDGFVNESLHKNLVVLRIAEGVYFRGTYVCSGWILTVAHAFRNMRDGTPFSIIHEHSICNVQFNATQSRLIEGQDVILLRVGDPDGPKSDIRKHFPRRDDVCYSKGSMGLCVRAVASKDPKKSNLEVLKYPVMMSKGYTEKVTYGLDSNAFALSSQVAYEYHINSENGDCGTLLLLPTVQNKQPCIVGIHCASYDDTAAEKGYVASNATAVFRDQLEDLPTGPIKVAMVRCELLKHLRSKEERFFEEKQVAFLGTVPLEMAATVPHKTTLKRSPLFEAFGDAQTAPSILSAKDKRGEGFDPYVAGVEKYNETASNFEEPVAKLAFEGLKASILPVLKMQRVPGGKPAIRNEDVVLNGIDGFDYFDAMELSTSCGYPFNKLGLGSNKREFVEAQPDSQRVLLKRNTPVFDAWEELDSQVRQGTFVDLVTTQCAKDERLPLEKIYGKRKTRLFEILPFHYNMLVRKYFLDFSACLMAAHNVLPCKVGINPTSHEWTVLASSFRSVSDEGFSADYSSFDGRAPIFAFQWFCDLVDAFYGDEPGSPESNARHTLLMMASCHYTLCENKLFRLVGGMPSGFALTVIFNSLLNEFYMRYAFISLLRRPHVKAKSVGIKPNDFNQLFIAVYGDDNLVAVPMHLRWYDLPSIARELEAVNVVIKNGLDKSMDVEKTKFLDLSELTFLSRGFKRHALGYQMAPLKWVSVIEPIYWIRPAVGCPDVQAMYENIETGIREAFHHGQATYESFVNDVLGALKQRNLPIMIMPTYYELESQWLTEVTGDESIGVLMELSDAKNTYTPLPAGEKINFEEGVHEFAPDVFFCSARTASNQQWSSGNILVNCTGARRTTWVRGPANWKDFEGKIWPYTLAAIQDHQRKNLEAGDGATSVTFVCGNGYAIAPICAALFALATHQYRTTDLIVRLRTMAGVLDLNTYPGGCAQYLLKCVEDTSHKLGQSGTYGTTFNHHHSAFSVGLLRIVPSDLSEKMAARLPYTIGPEGGWAQCSTKNLKHALETLSVSYATLAARGVKVTLYFKEFSQHDCEMILEFLESQGVVFMGSVKKQMLSFMNQQMSKTQVASPCCVTFSKAWLTKDIVMTKGKKPGSIPAETVFLGNPSALVVRTMLRNSGKSYSCTTLELAFRMYMCQEGYLDKAIVDCFSEIMGVCVPERILVRTIAWLSTSLNENITVYTDRLFDHFKAVDFKPGGFSWEINDANMNAADAVLFELWRHWSKSQSKFTFANEVEISNLLLAVYLENKLTGLEYYDSIESLDLLQIDTILANVKYPGSG